ncbi:MULTISPECIES: hypothetical protein [Caldilinea]|jgi:hypothetical protein|uniref:HD domain-containing protein n=1 Tax=Caldilinea aerophila (strain DSM 14535 / JCM 11387 / NBRC 104270 / STL-6-O1) TaxID=926550 RepID=I0I091_CALAS|nr:MULTISPECIES: hypothetical protein [Caldilinea]BAL98678.1 hypothetical protein CLDAP_06390 [Caldilinea aerophila DSM 14535 = NBRC 104270]GIV74737.1 MAG: hypothetical protein KatS3mg049_3293 [Caldilinea sp.]
MRTIRTSEGRRLEEFLTRCRAATLWRALSEEWLNALIPGIRLLIGCDQGNDMHLEGDAATHTVMTCMALPIFARRYLDREPDFVERLAALIHDWKKPVCRRGFVQKLPFPGHEMAAAAEVPSLARRIGLSAAEMERLHFVVANHGVAHAFPYLPAEERRRLATSPHWVSLGLLQAADAHSCWLPGGGHLPIHWELLEWEALTCSGAALSPTLFLPISSFAPLDLSAQTYAQQL